MDLAYRRRHYLGAAVFKVVPVYHGNDRMFGAHFGDGLRHPQRFPQVDLPGKSCFYRAEAAASGTGIPEDHEGRRSVFSPALMNVGAAGFLANGIKFTFSHILFDGVVILVGQQAHPDPGGFSGVIKTLFHRLLTYSSDPIVAILILCVNSLIKRGIPRRRSRSRPSAPLPPFQYCFSGGQPAPGCGSVVR